MWWKAKCDVKSLLGFYFVSLRENAHAITTLPSRLRNSIFNFFFLLFHLQLRREPDRKHWMNYISHGGELFFFLLSSPAWRHGSSYAQRLLGSTYLWEVMLAVVRIKESIHGSFCKWKGHPLSSGIKDGLLKEKRCGTKRWGQRGQDKSSVIVGVFHQKGAGEEILRGRNITACQTIIHWSFECKCTSLFFCPPIVALVH